MGGRDRAFRTTRTTDERRPGYSADRKRRRRFVERALRADGVRMADGQWRAVCQVCKQTMTLPLSDWWADHILPVAQRGDEGGPLRLSCKYCQLKQASRVGNARNPMAQSRKRPQEKHPGDLT
jgi:hypothetical protein